MRKKNIIGSRVRDARKESRMTQMELALRMQLLGVPMDRSAVAKLESGRRPISDIEAAAIAKILGITIARLFEASDSMLDSLGVQ